MTRVAHLAKAVRSIPTSVATWVRNASYLPKWLVLGSIIGAIAGLGAVVFSVALAGATHLLLGELAGYQPPTAAGDGGAAGSGEFTRPWAVPLVVALGGLVSGVIVFTLAPEAEGHGTDAAIEAFHRNPRMIRIRVVLVKLVASAITIGSGGSGGREGPTAQISAGFGSLLARKLDLSDRDGRIAVAVGIGSGIGAIFGAPLGGAVLCCAIPYKDDFEYDVLVPGMVASIVSYSVFGSILGFGPLFGAAASEYTFESPIQLVWFAIIGILAGLIGLLCSGTFYAFVDLSHRLPGSRIVKPAVGGLLVGLMALALPEVLGSGYGWIQQSMARVDLAAIPLWVVLLLPFAKILATSLSIGSGGSGGIFGPGMVIGAFTGAAVWRLLEPIVPGVPDSPAPFVIVGMMACFGSIARAPLAVMLMVAEMTGSIGVLAPGMVAVALAYLIVRRSGKTIYRAQLENREEARQLQNSPG
ncbi:chloride channel protein [Rhodococcus sp. ZPP]|uniref:chloride channel protein n=1 Tax=Rhodococcus sp. ZPP TaxID=2749906 RepID=UPI001AD871FD|nr:chloride channel protein [Rhodococcus sp. ZPP]QTJ68653.1 chloride channel protein [Rhodococcus sp. ZPP]